MASHKVGGEVDAFCTKCKMTLAHTILAMVGTKVARVRCNTCMGEHAYRGAPGSASKPRASKPRGPSKEEKIIIGWEQRLAGKDLASAPKYSPQETFAVDQVLNHPTFGIGIVSAVRGDKVEVAFKGDTKTLIHGRGGGAPAAKPAYEAPKGRRPGPADKPMAEGDEAPVDQEALDEVADSMDQPPDPAQE